MENQRVKVLDGAVEVSLRALCILYENRAPMTKDRIAAYDYFSLYSKDMNSSLDNLMSEIQLYSTSYVGEIQTITKAISILSSRDLITFEISNGAVYYEISEIGDSLVGSLSERNDYAQKLFKHIKVVKEFFNDFSEEQMSEFVKTHISNWSEEATI